MQNNVLLPADSVVAWQSWKVLLVRIGKEQTEGFTKGMVVLFRIFGMFMKIVSNLNSQIVPIYLQL